MLGQVKSETEGEESNQMSTTEKNQIEQDLIARLTELKYTLGPTFAIVHHSKNF